MCMFLEGCYDTLSTKGRWINVQLCLSRFIYCADKVLPRGQDCDRRTKTANANASFLGCFCSGVNGRHRGCGAGTHAFVTLRFTKICAFLWLGLIRLDALELSSYGDVNPNWGDILPVINLVYRHQPDRGSSRTSGGSRTSATQISHCEIRSDPCRVSKCSFLIWLFINTRKAALCFTVTYQYLQK